MFKYRYVNDDATGNRYWIDKAVLVNEGGPCAEGGDWYEIDLQPVNPNEPPITGLDLIDFGGGEVHITKDLNPRRRHEPADASGRSRAVTVIAVVDGDTLSVQGDSEGYCLNGWSPDESDRLMILRYLWEKLNSASSGEESCRLHEKLDFALNNPAAARRDAVVREMQEDMSYYAGIDGAAGHDKELAAFYRRVLGAE